MKKLILTGLFALNACGNDPVTYAGYFDEDQDRSIVNDNSIKGEQVYNNYGSGNINITNNNGSTYIQYDNSKNNTIDVLKITFNPSDFIAFINLRNMSADTLRLQGEYVTNYGFVEQFWINGWIEIPPYQTRSVSVDTGAEHITITSITFLNELSEVDNIWVGELKF